MVSEPRTSEAIPWVRSSDLPSPPASYSAAMARS